MNASGIYVISSPSGGEYVGSAVNMRRRWHQHRTDLRTFRHKNGKLQNAWNKYGESQIEFHVLLVCDKSNLLFFEQRAIDALGPRYNICPMAKNALGVKRSVETRLKLRIVHTGLKQSKETRAKRALAMTGHKVSAGTRAKLAAQRGWKHSEFAKAKMRGRKLTSAQLSALRNAAIGNKNRLGAVIPQEMRDRISAKLRGRERSPESVEKQRATLALRRAQKAR